MPEEIYSDEDYGQGQIKSQIERPGQPKGPLEKSQGNQREHKHR
jgi:hypothetical protein